MTIESDAEAIDRDVRQRLAANVVRAQAGALAGVPTIALLMAGNTAARWVVAWVIVAVADCVRAVLSARGEVQRAAQPGPDPRFFLRNAPHYLSFGVVWGAPAPIVAFTSNGDGFWFVVIGELAVLGLLAVAVAGTRRLFTISAVTLLALLTVALIEQGENPWKAAATTLLYLAISVFIVDTVSRSLLDAIRSRHDHAATASELQQHLAERDPLTGLPNRSSFLRALDDLVASRRQLASAVDEELSIAAGNVRQLTSINEMYGDETGTAVLVAVARRLKTLAGEHCAVARLGGDEFAIAVVRRRATISATTGEFGFDDLSVDVADRNFEIGFRHASIAGPITSVVAAELLADATARLRMRRSAQRSAALSVAERPSPAERRAMAHVLRGGLREAGVRAWFQPIVAADDHRIEAWEALARWEHPDGRVIPPSVLLPLVNVLGMDGQLLELIVDDAAALLAALPDRSIAAHVNATAEDLRRPDVADQLIERVVAAGVDPRRFVVELTETDILEIDDAVRANVQVLAVEGVRLAVDDFGTGFSSLSHLLDLATDHIKIDRRFVSRLPGDPAARSLVSSVIRMALGLGVGTVAEGVETHAQAACLAELGCTQIQGFLVAGAMRIDDATAFRSIARQPDTTPRPDA